MGKKKQATTLGRSIIRDRFGGRGRGRGDSSHLHTSELDDGCDWNRINLRSVTEQTSLDEFLTTAELAGTEFTAEKLNIKFVSAASQAGLMSAEEQQQVLDTQNKHRALLSIPRRPRWDGTTSAEELDEWERDSFLKWRRQLAELQEVEGLILTPYERNLDFWRQLWRVIERSDIIAQIVDARNPLLFRCEDLEKYVQEVDKTKFSMLLINKADYLMDSQREAWAAYFDSVGIKVAFWSAAQEAERNKDLEAVDMEEGSEEDDEEDDDEEDESSEEAEEQENMEEQQESEDIDDSCTCSDQQVDDAESKLASQCKVTDSCVVDPIPSTDNRLQNQPSPEQTENSPPSLENAASDSNGDKQVTFSASAKTSDANSTSCDSGSISSTRNSWKNNPDILTGVELMDLFQQLHTGKKYQDGVNTIGLVGYPNVGKSSTINSLLRTKKVPVSATPGRTKHFQTLYLDPTLLLCDCPGLVMPTFVSTKAEMVISGILPIDQMRDYVGPVAQVCHLIPRQHLETTYGVILPKPGEGEDPARPPTPHELLSAYGFMRGYMTHKGIPDFQRGSRVILKDFVTGKLLFCHPPPGTSEVDFICTPAPSKTQKVKATETKGNKPVYMSEVDQAFFNKTESRIGSKGIKGGVGIARQDGGLVSGSQPSLQEKSWKKHHNKGKKQKLRRMNRHLDA